jgi:hypothetical protein
MLIRTSGRETALRDVAHAFVQAERVSDILKIATAAPPNDQTAILA